MRDTVTDCVLSPTLNSTVPSGSSPSTNPLTTAVAVADDPFWESLRVVAVGLRVTLSVPIDCVML